MPPPRRVYERTHDLAASAGADLGGPADLVGDPAGVVASAGPAAGASAGCGTTDAADPAGVAGTAGTGEVAATAAAAGTVVGVVGRRHEVPVDNPERGDRDCHNRNTYCRPADNPLHGVPAYHMLYTKLELTVVTVPAAAIAVGDTAVV